MWGKIACLILVYISANYCLLIIQGGYQDIVGKFFPQVNKLGQLSGAVNGTIHVKSVI